MKWQAIVCFVLLALGAAGFVVTAGFATEAANWRGAENYAALAVVILGQLSVFVQMVSLPAQIFLSAKLEATSKRAVLIIGCLLPLATAIALYLGDT